MMGLCSMTGCMALTSITSPSRGPGQRVSFRPFTRSGSTAFRSHRRLSRRAPDGSVLLALPRHSMRPPGMRPMKVSDMNRRTLLSGSACAAVLGLAGRPIPAARAAAPRILTVDSRTIEVNGRSAKVFGLTGPDGKPGLTFNAGDMFEVTLDNRLAEKTMIHWHGLTPPTSSTASPTCRCRSSRRANSGATASPSAPAAPTGCMPIRCRSRPSWPRR